MRLLFLSIWIVCTAAAQTVTGPAIAVVDENGVAVQSAGVSLEIAGKPVAHCETNFTGRCSLPGIAAGVYTLRVQFFQQQASLAARSGRVQVDHSAPTFDVFLVPRDPPEAP